MKTCLRFSSFCNEWRKFSIGHACKFETRDEVILTNYYINSMFFMAQIDTIYYCKDVDKNDKMLNYIPSLTLFFFMHDFLKPLAIFNIVSIGTR